MVSDENFQPNYILDGLFPYIYPCEYFIRIFCFSPKTKKLLDVVRKLIRQFISIGLSDIYGDMALNPKP